MFRDLCWDGCVLPLTHGGHALAAENWGRKDTDTSVLRLVSVVLLYPRATVWMVGPCPMWVL